jgi:serine/threonine protein kinase
MKFQAIDAKYQNLLLNITTYFTQANSNLHKARNILKVITYEQESYVVKSFKIPHLLNKIVYTFFRDSKAKKSYENSIRIKPFTPKAIGYIEFKKYGLLNESYFVSEHFPYDFTIREPLLDKNFANRQGILEEFAKFSYTMHEQNIFHNDYSPGNILIKKEGANYIFKVVDVNRMKFFHLTCQDRARNFSQLWADDEDITTIADAYLRYYNTNENFEHLALMFSQQHKKSKNFKKRLKGQKIDV